VFAGTPASEQDVSFVGAGGPMNVEPLLGKWTERRGSERITYNWELVLKPTVARSGGTVRGSMFDWVGKPMVVLKRATKVFQTAHIGTERGMGGQQNALKCIGKKTKKNQMRAPGTASPLYQLSSTKQRRKNRFKREFRGGNDKLRLNGTHCHKSTQKKKKEC